MSGLKLADKLRRSWVDDGEAQEAADLLDACEKYLRENGGTIGPWGAHPAHALLDRLRDKTP